MKAADRLVPTPLPPTASIGVLDPDLALIIFDLLQVVTGRYDPPTDPAALADFEHQARAHFHSLMLPIDEKDLSGITDPAERRRIMQACQQGAPLTEYEGGK